MISRETELKRQTGLINLKPRKVGLRPKIWTNNEQVSNTQPFKKQDMFLLVFVPGFQDIKNRELRNEGWGSVSGMVMLLRRFSNIGTVYVIEIVITPQGAYYLFVVRRRKQIKVSSICDC